MSKDKNKIKSSSKHFWASFKEFISRGNVVDLAVAVIIGAAFGAIITSLVNDLIMPLITSLLGGATVDQLFFVVPAVPWAVKNMVAPDGSAFAGTILSDGTVVHGTPVFYGRLLQAIINFLIISFVIFVAVKVVIQHKQYKQKMLDELAAKETAAKQPEIPDDIKLLMEIRDSIRALKQPDEEKKE